MKRIFFTFLLTISAHAIDGGIPTHKNEFPGVIKIANARNGAQVHCTGTLFHPELVLTAAHCVDKNFFKQQSVSYMGDHTGELFHLFKKKIRVKNVFVHPLYEETKLRLELLDSYIRTDFFKNSSPSDQQQKFYERHELYKRVRNLDLAFIELESPQQTPSHGFPIISCDPLPPMVQVVMVGYGQNVGTSNGKNLNTNFKLLKGYNWYTLDDLYDFTSDRGQLVNGGDSGGPLFIKDHPSMIYGVASVKIMNKKQINQKSTYASTASLEARSFYQFLQTNAKAPESLKGLTSSCLNIERPE